MIFVVEEAADDGSVKCWDAKQLLAPDCVFSWNRRSDPQEAGGTTTFDSVAVE